MSPKAWVQNNIWPSDCSVTRTFLLELRQYKNDSIQSKIIPGLKLPRFPSPYRWQKRAEISKMDFFSTEWRCSYIILALNKLRRKIAIADIQIRSKRPFLRSFPILKNSYFQYGYLQPWLNKRGLKFTCILNNIILVIS